MEKSKDTKPGGSAYMNPDADFGTFKPPPDNNRYNVYSPWTQFSGIPPPANDPSAFSWDSFVTPPPTPSPGADFDMRNQNYFPSYNLMHGIGRDSPDYDPDPREADSAMLASTPVAQSLIEASLHSPNPLISPLPDGSMPMNFQDASQEGMDMYAETMSELGQYHSYNPFGTADVLNTGTVPVPPAPVIDDEKQNTDNLKPSYSDVAKTLKSNVNPHKEKPDKDTCRKKVDGSMSRSFKSNKKFVPRPIRGRNSVSEDLRTTVSPNSKYGLDDFSDVPSGKVDKETTSTGLDEIPPLTRKNSTSSVSSGTSGIEEIQLTKSCNNYGNASEDSPAVEKIDPGKDKAKHFDGNINKEENVKPFFDARRIFQSKDTNKRRSQSNSKLEAEEEFGPILNNGKPSYQAWCTNAAHKKTTHYINNNLRDSQKKTNQNTGMSGGPKEEKDNTFPPSSSSRGEKSRTRNVSSTSASKSDASTATSNSKTSMPLQTSFDQELIDEWLSFLYDKVKLCMHQLWTLVLMVVLLIFSVIVYLVSGCVHILSWMWAKLWNLLENKLFKGKFFSGQNWGKRVPEVPKKIGIEENIALPSTGDEAMQRLLACKGKDPYSILGLKASATDDDIKKYYRRQAVLVHPDKNQQPGAEEAFKILGHAFDLIGESEKRQTYDRQLQEATEAEAAMRQFNDLLTKLQDKIQQASNMMRCDNCGGKHKRVPIERPWYSARFCDRCSIRHSAKEGDVWAETSFLGFLWHYYACMEGKVFDITEWVACKKDFFKHMQANAHHVFYRIATENTRGSGGNRHDRSGSGGGGGEAELEDFISHLFHQAMHTDGTNSQSWQQPPPTTSPSWNQPSSQPTTTSTKRNRRKKKKH